MQTTRTALSEMATVRGALHAKGSRGSTLPRGPSELSGSRHARARLLTARWKWFPRAGANAMGTNWCSLACLHGAGSAVAMRSHGAVTFWWVAVARRPVGPERASLPGSVGGATP